MKLTTITLKNGMTVDLNVVQNEQGWVASTTDPMHLVGVVIKIGSTKQDAVNKVETFLNNCVSFGSNLTGSDLRK